MMYYNDLKITLRTNKVAVKALEIISQRLSLGFDCDCNYDDAPSTQMMKELYVTDRVVTFPSNSNLFAPEDMCEVVSVLLKDLAESIEAKTFSCRCSASSEDDYCIIDATYKKNELSVEYTYYPVGPCEKYYCDSCGAFIIFEDEYEAGKTYICPDCGEEVDLTKQIPVTAYKNFQIA